MHLGWERSQPEPPRIVKPIPSRSRQSVKPRQPAAPEVELGLEMEVEAEQDQAGDVFTAPTDEYLVVTGTGDDIARRRVSLTRFHQPGRVESLMSLLILGMCRLFVFFCRLVG